jgi:uncharacterized protein (TIGR04141 family)
MRGLDWPHSISLAQYQKLVVAKPQPSPNGKKLRLTVFLIKDGYKKIEDFLEVAGLQRIEIGAAQVEGTLFFRMGVTSVAPWAMIFANVHGFNPSSIVNRHSRGLYILKEHGRWFCFTFGYTRQLIDEAAVERNFGLIVSLNLGDPAAIKAIEKINISQVGLQSREQAGKDVAFGGFEFDTDIDLLKSMTAKGPQKITKSRKRIPAVTRFPCTPGSLSKHSQTSRSASSRRFRIPPTASDTRG